MIQITTIKSFLRQINQVLIYNINAALTNNYNIFSPKKYTRKIIFLRFLRFI